MFLGTYSNQCFTYAKDNWTEWYQMTSPRSLAATAQSIFPGKYKKVILSFLYSQTIANELLQIMTICLQQPLF
jgi:hypothetical protein